MLKEYNKEHRVGTSTEPTPERAPQILLKDIPKPVYDLIVDKQSEQRKKHRPINLSQAVVMLIKEAYLKAESTPIQ